jgi:hypothetical protein
MDLILFNFSFCSIYCFLTYAMKSVLVLGCSSAYLFCQEYWIENLKVDPAAGLTLNIRNLNIILGQVLELYM